MLRHARYGPQTRRRLTLSVVPRELVVETPTSVLVDYTVIQGRQWLARWEQQRPIRIARRTLKTAIKDPDTPENRKALYREKLADLHDHAIAQQLQQLTARSVTREE